MYGHGDLGRGVKIAIDRHGPPIDPDTADRSVGAEAIETVRRELAQRLPGLATAPILETRVCQYQSSANGDFVIDRHPASRTSGSLEEARATGSNTDRSSATTFVT